MDEHSLGLTDPRIIQILNQSKEGRAADFIDARALRILQERFKHDPAGLARQLSRPPTSKPSAQNAPTFSLRNLINALVFSVIIATLLTLLMIMVIEVLRWFF